VKIIEALKQSKDLLRKADDLKVKVKNYHAHNSLESAVYPTQESQVKEWMQAFSDVLKEILHLRVSITRTNLLTDVSIELGGKTVTKSIAEWIHRRRDLAQLEGELWNVLDDKRIQEGFTTNSAGDKIEVKIVRYYDPAERDRKRELFRSEPTIIDGKLEIVNAVTELIEK